MQRTTHMDWKTAALTGILVVGLLSFPSSQAEARRRQRSFKGSSDLTATSADANARGKVKASAKGDDGRFEVSASKLDRNASYEVIVGGVKVAGFTTSGGGGGKTRLRANPRGKDGLLGFDPRGADVVIRNAAGQDVLFGTVPADDSNNDGGEIICCVPGDSGTECEDRTPAECAAEGGTASTATSCVPNPCEGSTPPSGGEIVCCLPDDNAFECEDRTSAECLAQGGVDMGAGTCTPNPCGSLPPPPSSDVRCCLPDDSGTECEDRSAAACATLGGVDRGVGVCAPDSCTGVSFPGSPSGGDDQSDDHGGQSGKH